MRNTDTEITLTDEQKLVILCGRLTFRDSDIQALKELGNKKLNWFEILNYCIKNKVVSLVWSNLINYKINSAVPNPIYDIFEYYSYMTGMRNVIIIKEAHVIQEELLKDGIKCIPLKGLILIPELYKNYQIRHMNDIDMMIDIEDRNKVKGPLSRLGFRQGRPDRVNDKIKDYSRSELISWNINMNNMPLFVKMREERYARFLEIDFTFGIDFNRKNTAVSTMLKSTCYEDRVGFECLNKVDFFIHLCAHLYKEATNAVFIIYYQDINLIKFCDVREYFISNYSKEWFEEVCKRAKEFNAEKALYYSLYYSFLVFDDDYEECLKMIEIEDYNFVYSFGKREWGEDYKWKKGFYERLFSQSNMDEIEEKPEIKLI